MAKPKRVATDPSVLASLGTLAATLAALRYGIPLTETTELVNGALQALAGAAAAVFGLRTWVVSSEKRLKK